MIDAATAAKMTGDAKQRIAEEQRRKDEEKAEARRKQAAWEMEHELPKHLLGIERDIEAAIAKGERSITFRVNYTVAREVVDAVENFLVERKFRVAHQYFEGRDNMGDFNAPCMMDWSATDFRISW